MEYIRQLYKLLGGNPADLDGDTPAVAMATVYAAFAQNGLPDLTPSQVDDALSDIEDMEDLLASPPPSIDPNDFSKLAVIRDALESRK